MAFGSAFNTTPVQAPLPLVTGPIQQAPLPLISGPGIIDPLTQSGPSTTSSSQTPDLKGMGKWLLAMGLLWFVLTVAADNDLGQPAAAFAVLIASTVVLAYGPQALKNLGFLT